jgi:primosomal protein N' (replication factor Y)
MEERRVPGYPPYSRLANIVVSGADESAVRTGIQALADWSLETIRKLGADQVRLIGPAPCAIDRIRGRWRWHFLLRSMRAGALGTVLQALKEREGLSGTKGDLRFIIDRDPVTLL